MHLEKVATGLSHAEAPVWSLEGYLLFSDTVQDKVKKFVPGKGVEEVGSRPGGASGMTFDEQGRLYTCEPRDRRVTRLSKNGKNTEVIAARFEGKRLNAPNDIVVRRDGNVYFTDPAFGNQQDSRELDYYGVFRINPKGEMEAVARWKSRPNGFAVSPNGRLLYVANSDERSIHVFDLDRSGVASNDRLFLTKLEGVPGGIRTDEKGKCLCRGSKRLGLLPAGRIIENHPNVGAALQSRLRRWGPLHAVYHSADRRLSCADQSERLPAVCADGTLSILYLVSEP